MRPLENLNKEHDDKLKCSYCKKRKRNGKSEFCEVCQIKI
jgi:hypothetical protein